MRTLVSEDIGAFIVVEGWHLFLDLEVFSLQESLLSYFTEPFPCRSISKRGVQDISLHTHEWRPSLGYVRTISLMHTFQLNVVSFPSSTQVNPISMKSQTPYCCHVSVDTRPTSLSGTSLYAFISMIIFTILPLSNQD